MSEQILRLSGSCLTAHSTFPVHDGAGARGATHLPEGAHTHGVRTAGAFGCLGDDDRLSKRMLRLPGDTLNVSERIRPFAGPAIKKLPLLVSEHRDNSCSNQ